MRACGDQIGDGAAGITTGDQTLADEHRVGARTGVRQQIGGTTHTGRFQASCPVICEELSSALGSEMCKMAKVTLASIVMVQNNGGARSSCHSTLNSWA